MTMDELPSGPGCYLIEFDRPYQHARHYLGASRNIRERVGAHLSGTGARLLQVCKTNGIGWQVVRVWPTETVPDAYHLESKLKAHHGGTKLCPSCVARKGLEVEGEEVT